MQIVPNTLTYERVVAFVDYHNTTVGQWLHLCWGEICAIIIL